MPNLMQPRWTRIITLACVFWMLAGLAQAQVLYGTLTGNVSDQTGAFLPNAQVEALNVGTGLAQTATSDASGDYRFAALQAGNYRITVKASGFGNAVFDNVRVDANTVRRVDVKLAVAKTEQSVEVTGEAALLQTDKADVHTDLSAQQVENLPIAGSQGRNFQSLLRIIPGVGLTAETNSLAGNPQRAINANVNGQSNQGNNTRLDGAQDLYPWLPANVAYVPPADAIETVNVVTNSFDAEQGMAGGAAVNVQIKSGTNNYHGSGHWYHTDQNFAARNYFQTDATIFPHKNRNNQNQLGGTIGGPIVKNKLFFFGDYERTTQRQKAGPVVLTLPLAQMITGDFRNLPGNPIIYDPMTGDNHGVGKQQIACNGVLNTICSSRFDPAANKLIALIQPFVSQEFATANGLSNFQTSSTALFNRDNTDIKINYVPSQKSTVFGRYSFSRSLAFDPPVLGTAGGGATGGGQLGNAPGLIQSIGLGTTYTFTPSLLLDWNFGFTRQRLGATFDLDKARGIDELGIPGTNGSGFPGDATLYNGLPWFNFNPTGSTPLALGNNNTGNPFTFRDQQWVTGANLSWNKGKHAIRGGVEWNRGQLNHFQPQGGTFQTPRGTLQFNGGVTSLRGATTNWFNSFADFLLGLSSGTGKAGALFNPTALRWSQYAWYLRDQWQLRPDLTVTLGLRWEYYPFGVSDNGKGLRYFDMKSGNVLIGGYGSIPRDDGIDVGHGLFLPRVGVAWRARPSTVVRAGYGMSADPNNWRYFRNAYPSAILIANTITNGDAVAVASLTGKNATGLGGGSYQVPTGIVLTPIPDLSSGVIPLPTNIGTTTIPNPFKRGYINSFNLMFEQEWKGIVLETGYVGARGVRPLVNMNANASPPGTGSAGGLLSVALGKNYTGGINQEIPFKNNQYDSLQTKLTRRFKQGTLAGLVWTWSKSIDYQGNEELSAIRFPYPTFWERNRAVSDFDRSHNVKIYGVFLPPFGKGQRWATSGIASHILGGWQINPVISRLTGLPFTVGAGGSLNANGSGQIADLVGKYVLTGGKPPRTGVTCAQTDPSCHYFEPAAFAAPLITSNANAHYGNVSRNEFRGPGYFQTDLSLAREFRITERVNFQLRAEAFSLTNTPHFANPSLSCPGSATTPGPVATSGQLCNTGSNNNFGVITGTLQPGGFFGPDPGNRSIWLAAKVTF